MSAGIEDKGGVTNAKAPMNVPSHLQTRKPTRFRPPAARWRLWIAPARGREKIFNAMSCDEMGLR